MAVEHVLNVNGEYFVDDKTENHKWGNETTRPRFRL